MLGMRGARPFPRRHELGRAQDFRESGLSPEEHQCADSAGGKGDEREDEFHNE